MRIDKNMMLTGIYETNLEILSRMNLDTLIDMCFDDNLWRMKILYDFGEVISYKPRI
jgi:hypothetical protein